MTSELEKQIAEIEGEKTGLVVFTLGNSHYAFCDREAREILPLEEVSYVPALPEFVAGIINVRGEIQSVLDLKNILGLPAGAAPGKRHVIIVEAHGVRTGILVDAIADVLSVAKNSIRQDAVPVGPARQIAAGEIVYEGGAAVLLAADRLLAQILDGGAGGPPGGEARGAGAERQAAAAHELRLLVFRAGGVRFGVDMEQIDEMVDLAAMEQTARKAWRFHELVAYSGRAVEYENPKVLLIRGDEDKNGIIIDCPEDIIDAAIETLQPLPRLIEARRQSPVIWASALLEGEAVLLIDFYQLPFLRAQAAGNAPATGC